MNDGPTLPGSDDENVVVTPGDVTSIGDATTGGDGVATGGAAIAASLTPDADVLNIAFVTGGGDVQFIQIALADLMPSGATGSNGDVVVSAELTALSGDVISSGSGAATPIGTVAVAANLADDGDLSLSFADGNDHLQLIETNIAELLQSLRAAGEGAPASSAEPGPSDLGR